MKQEKANLPGHHFAVSASDFHAGVQTRAIVRVHYGAPDRAVCAHTAVVRTLRRREAILGPSWQIALTNYINRKNFRLSFILFQLQLTLSYPVILFGTT